MTEGGGSEYAVPVAVRGSWSTVVVAALATVTVLLLTSNGVLLLAAFIRGKASHTSRRLLPPGPRGWPFLGYLPMLANPIHQTLYNLSKQYGPIMWLRLGSVGALVVTSQKYAEEILKTQDKVMSTRPSLIVPMELMYHGNGLILANGQHWRYVRKLCTLSLLTSGRISQFRESREREVMAILHFILEESQKGNAANMATCFSTVNCNNMTNMIMNRSYCNQSEASSVSLLKGIIEEVREVFALPNMADYIPIMKPFDPQGLHKRSKAVHQKIDKYFEDVIQEHSQRRPDNTENYKEDFLDALLGLRQKEKSEEHLSMASIKGILLDMIGAGGDTTSNTAQWALAEILKNPLVLRRVIEELDAVVGPHRLLQEEDLPQLQYVNAVVKEIFRLHPPTPLLLPHESTEDCEIGEFHIPARTQIFVNAWGIQRDPSVWERPLEFDPDRFLNSSKDFKGQHFDLIPFGSGRRMCPGLSLGFLMVIYPVFLLLHALDFTPPEGEKFEEMDMTEKLKTTLEKRVPLRVFGKARLPRHVLYPAQDVKK